MADGRTHDQSTFFTSFIVMASTFAIAYRYRLSMALVVGAFIGHLFGGLWLSPDLDLPHSYPSQRWWWLRWVWSPYRTFVPHRHWISHTPIIGSTVRLLYLTALICGVLAVLGRLSSFLAWADANRLLLAGFALGVESSALLHLSMDGIPLGSGKGRRKR